MNGTTEPETTRDIVVVIADDHAIFRDGFKLLLRKLKSKQIVFGGEAANGEELLELTERVHPDVVITDIQMPVMTGIEAALQIKRKFEEVQVIALSMFNEEHLVLDMLEAGASGYLLKNTSREELYKAIQAVVQGSLYFTPETAVHLSRTIEQSGKDKKPQKIVHFSNREKEIIHLICKGLINKEMAAKLNLSIRTVESYRENIYEKTGTRRAVEVAIYAIKHGIVNLEEI